MKIKATSAFRLQAIVFALVSASFTTIYLLQPVLPVLQLEFGVDENKASLGISAVILGIALSNLPFGRLADRRPIKPIILVGGLVVILCGLGCAIVQQITLLVLLRFIQGLFIPALTTCLAAYLAKNLPVERLNVVMGSYVSATVAGGLGGRLLGGWLHPPLHWRYAFITVSVLVLLATVSAIKYLPSEKYRPTALSEEEGFITLLKRSELLRIYSVAFFSFWIFSALFNYLPFYLAGPAFNASTRRITIMYMAYILGIVVGPLSGKLSNRIGNGATMVLGAAIWALALAATHITSLWAVVAGLSGICVGFFAIHSAAAGSLNQKLKTSRGRANSLYVLFYYLGGSTGITVCGFGYQQLGWRGVTGTGMVLLVVIFAAGMVEMRASK
ncbi:MAG: MFS transporter [Desulfobacteraceae bacterium]|jgi:YNFM family putative membrane transporter